MSTRQEVMTINDPIDLFSSHFYDVRNTGKCIEWLVITPVSHTRNNVLVLSRMHIYIIIFFVFGIWM